MSRFRSQSPDWSGRTAVIAASGPSLTLAQCRAVEAAGVPSISTNATFKLLPSSLVYIGDMLAIKHYVPQIPDAKRRVWTADANAMERYGLNGVKGVTGEGLCLKPGVITMNGNSGFSAISLAFMFGSRRLLLVGMDMKPGAEGERHWHEDHPKPMNPNQTFEQWIHKSVKLARDLAANGCEVVNCSLDTALTCWPRGDLETELAK